MDMVDIMVEMDMDDATFAINNHKSCHDERVFQNRYCFPIVQLELSKYGSLIIE